MVVVLHEQSETVCASARADGEHLWIDAGEFQTATGWSLKPEGFCRGTTCVPVPPGRAHEFVAGSTVNAAAFWRRMGNPVMHDATRQVWVLGTSAADRSASLQSLEAPDFNLPDLDGRMRTLSEHRGKKVLLATWASWCGCRADLPVWQSLYADLKGSGFVVVAVAIDVPEAARPWIEAAKPDYPCLIDRDHHVADLYNMLNVPQAVWIDEEGRIVRPAENAGSSDAFRNMDRVTKQMTPEQLKERERTKSIYVAAVRDWVSKGPASEFVYDAAQVRARLRLPDTAITEAHAQFRLAQYLVRHGKRDEAVAHFSEASRLHPESWTIWRQAAEKDATGLATGPEFWARVDALGDRPYHRLIDMKGV